MLVATTAPLLRAPTAFFPDSCVVANFGIRHVVFGPLRVVLFVYHDESAGRFHVQEGGLEEVKYGPGEASQKILWRNAGNGMQVNVVVELKELPVGIDDMRDNGS